jgi:hypothetical protein
MHSNTVTPLRFCLNCDRSVRTYGDPHPLHKCVRKPNRRTEVIDALELTDTLRELDITRDRVAAHFLSRIAGGLTMGHNERAKALAFCEGISIREAERRVRAHDSFAAEHGFMEESA